MNEEQAARYSRHIQLPQIGAAGQRRLLGSRVLVVGVGGLGAPAIMYLAASGIGQLALADYDRVELSNLQRQIIHATADIGRNKVDSARDRVLALNPEVRVDTIAWAMDDEELEAEVARADVVVDASDNFETRFALNAASVRTRTPLVSGAAVRMEAQVYVFEPGRADSPCYRCLYSDAGDDGEPCALVGVFAPMLGIIGSVEAAEAIKVLLGIGTTLTGRVVIFDALHTEWRSLTLPRDPACPVCGDA